MKAILMAAGYGGRISQFTNEPKSLLKVNGKSIIRNTVEMLLKNKIKVTIIVGYKHNLIREELKDLDVKFYYNPFFKVTNSIASLWLAKDELVEQDTILGNADVFYREDILERLTSTKQTVTMLGDKNRALVGDYFFSCKDGKIEKYGKELIPEERTCEYVGLAMIKKEFIKTFKNQVEYLVENGEYNLWWENALYTIADKYPIYVEDVGNNFWAEVDYIEDYKRIEEFIANEKNN